MAILDEDIKTKRAHIFFTSPFCRVRETNVFNYGHCYRKEQRFQSKIILNILSQTLACRNNSIMFVAN